MYSQPWSPTPSTTARAVERRAVRRRQQQRREVDAARLPVVDRLGRLQQLDAADQLVEAADAEPRHQLPRLLGNEEEEVDDVLWCPGEALAQHRILRRDPDRARV